jgi:acyl-CoA reductase-like NAD-dependent aldehyde dehydrogenase
MSFKLTYSTMFNPPAEMHERFEAALTKTKAGLGATHTFYINGAEVKGIKHDARKSPIDQRMVLGQFPVATADEAARAMDAAHAAFAGWQATPAGERVRLMKRAAALIEERVYDIAAALCLEVGKNRMEALADAQETADFFSLYADDFLKHDGFDHKLPDDPSTEFRAHNRSIAKPYGAWLVIAPYNFPFALAGGPVAAALVTGNTVVLKGATDTPWAGRLLADILRDAGFPPGVFNYVSGGGSVAGEALVAHPRLAGVTFTGSYNVGMHIFRTLANGRYPRPCITEMGGKNACIVTANADLERAANGIVRSAYGLSGQKCSATSRLYVDAKVADTLTEKLLQKIGALQVGDPGRKENWMGPVTTAGAYANYQRYSEQLHADGGKVLAGANVLRDGDLAHGFFVAPTFAEAPASHPLFDEEMFSPILMLCRVKDREEAMRLTNASSLGLTAGCFGNDEDVEYFFNHVEAGVTYANRAQGATTGAWPGFQPFGGWKGSSSSCKGIASFYYLAQYLREQSQTRVE